jgi:hypothetical protein
MGHEPITAMKKCYVISLEDREQKEITRLVRMSDSGTYMDTI